MTNPEQVASVLKKTFPKEKYLSKECISGVLARLNEDGSALTREQYLSDSVAKPSNASPSVYKASVERYNSEHYEYHSKRERIDKEL